MIKKIVIAALAILNPSSSYGMYTHFKTKEAIIEKYKKLTLDKAKKKLGRKINRDQAYRAQILITIFGPQFSQEYKNNCLVSCYNRPEIASLLLAIGADSNAHSHCKCLTAKWNGRPNDCHKESILHLAAKTGNSSTVQALLEYKAKVDAQDFAGETPFMKASRIQAVYWSRGDERGLGHYFKIIRLLLKYGADGTKINSEGETALKIAQKEIKQDKLRILIVAELSLKKIP